MLKVDAAGDRQVRATIALLKVAPTRVRRYMKQAARKALNQLWRPAIQARVWTRRQRRVILSGARGVVDNDMFTLRAAGSTRALSGGLVPTDSWHGEEFGMHPKRMEVSIQGHVRTQVVGRQFPNRRARGWLAYQAAEEVAPQVVATWTEALVAGAVQGTALETRKG